MDLHVYTPDFEYLGCVDCFSSLRFRRQLFEPGELEIHTVANSNFIALLQPENYILRDGRSELAILDGRVIKDRKNDGETIEASGRLGNALFDRCVINKTYNFSGSVEKAMRQLVQEQMSRICPNIIMGEEMGYQETIQTQITYKNLFSVLSALSKSSGIFFRLRPDVPNKKLIFETYKGVDRTVTQNLNPRVVFSDLEDTLDSPKHTQDRKKYRNFAYVAGEGEGIDRTIITIDRRTSPTEAIRELFIDAKDLRKKEISEAEYKKLLTQRGNQKLDNVAEIQNFETDVRPENGYFYLTDWDLGDKVTCHKSTWGIMMDERVTEVEEVYEEGNIGEVAPTLGSPFPEKFNLGG